MIIGAFSSMHEAGFQVSYHNGELISEYRALHGHMTFPRDATFEIARVGLRLVFSHAALYSVAYKYISIEIVYENTQHNIVTVPATILLDPEYGQSLEQDYLDPDTETGFCRTIPIQRYRLDPGSCILIYINIPDWLQKEMNEPIDGDWHAEVTPIIVVERESAWTEKGRLFEALWRQGCRHCIHNSIPGHVLSKGEYKDACHRPGGPHPGCSGGGGLYNDGPGPLNDF